MAPPAWAYQADNFDPAPDEELICSICRAIFCEPVQCPCNHVFCRICISEWLRRNRNCPICRKRATRCTIQDVVPLIKNMIMKLILRCRNSEQGCSEKFTLEGCENHMKICMFEMVQCKNKPCKQKLYRKDIGEHELNGCPHRYLKCLQCKMKISTALPESHNCIQELRKMLRRKVFLLRKRKLKIRELENEVKRLKEDASELNSSSSSSSSASDVMLSFADFDSYFSDSDDGESIFSDATDVADEGRNEVQGPVEGGDNSVAQELNDFGLFLELLGENYDSHNIESNVGNSPMDDQESIEQFRTSTPAAEADSSVNTVEAHRTISEDISPPRRPAKRRHPPVLLSSDEEDNNVESGNRPALPSPKRSWLLYPNRSSEASSLSVSENSSASSRACNFYSDAGPSFADLAAQHSESRDNLRSNSTPNFVSRFNFRPKLSQSKTQATKSSETAATTTTTDAVGTSTSPSASRTAFERTIALLEEYNLESDPEWLPQYASHTGDTPDSELSLASDSEHPSYLSTSSDESSELDVSDSTDGGTGVALGSDSSSDDPDWRPCVSP